MHLGGGGALNETHHTEKDGTPQVVQWIGTCLPVHGARAQSLVREDSTYLGAPKPMCRNYRGNTLQLLKTRVCPPSTREA